MSSLTESLANRLADNPVVYVTRDIERTLGIIPLPKGFFIVTNESAYAHEIQSRFPDQIILIKGQDKDTYELLELPEVKEYLKAKGGKTPQLLVFKNKPRIERLAQKEGWTLLNPSAALAEEIEGKVSQVKWLEEAAKYLVPGTTILNCKSIEWKGSPMIVQFAHSHTGEGTQLIENEDALDALAQKFPEREVRVSPFVQGPVFTSNNCLAGEKTLIGNISYQITGLSPFTDLPFSTIGNDFAYAHQVFHSDTSESKTRLSQYKEICKAVGTRLSASGWKGLFGIDVILNEKDNTVHLIEINARQPASTTFESVLQREVREATAAQPEALTIFEAHLAALLDVSILENNDPQAINSGAQIIQRVTNHITESMPKNLSETSESLRTLGFQVIEYPNTEKNSDLLRIQTKNSFISSHGILNDLGKSCAELCGKLV